MVNAFSSVPVEDEDDAGPAEEQSSTLEAGTASRPTSAPAAAVAQGTSGPVAETTAGEVERIDIEELTSEAREFFRNNQTLAVEKRRQYGERFLFRSTVL